jgi:hypothetical protein
MTRIRGEELGLIRVELALSLDALGAQCNPFG